MNTPLPFWVEAIVAVLIVAGAVFTLIGTWGLVRLPDFFLRMHAPALGATLGAWCVAAASVLYFSVRDGRLVFHPWLIPVFLSITVPITTSLLARTGVFRAREAGDKGVPPPLG
jgi:multicomponent K+:H+ antiporter subunit G